MGCRCSERTDELRRAAANLKTGNVRAAGREIASAARSFAQDAKSGDLKRAAVSRLAAIRAGRR